jgi:hypothetical protein
LNRRYIESLAKKFSNFNGFQMAHFHKAVQERSQKVNEISPFSINYNFPLEKDINITQTSFEEQKDIMKDLAKWYQSQNPNFGLGGGVSTSATNQGPAQTKEEKKEPVKEVKLLFTLIRGK